MNTGMKMLKRTRFVIHVIKTDTQMRINKKAQIGTEIHSRSKNSGRCQPVQMHPNMIDPRTGPNRV